MTYQELRAALDRANAALAAAAAKIVTSNDYSDYVGNPGIRSCGLGSPEDEEAFDSARISFIRAARELHRWVYGPALRAYLDGR